MRYFPLTLGLATLASPANAQFGPSQTLHSPSTRIATDHVDVDGDGVLDLVTVEETFSGTVDLFWHRGGAGAPFAAPQPLGSIAGMVGSFGGGTAVTSGDLDGDGFFDLAIVTNAGLIVMDGLGGAQFAPARTIDTKPASSLEMLDLDLDGDLDLLRGSMSTGSAGDALIFENDGAGSFTARSLTGSCCFYGVPLAGDIDLDGDLDLLLATGSDAEFLFFESQGGLSFLPPAAIPAIDGVPFASLGDADGDGDLDFLYANFIARPGGWVENQGGVFTTDHVLFPMTATVSAPQAVDVNGDGVQDLVFVQDIGTNWWLPGDGAGGFLAAQAISFGQNLVFVDLADVDGDGSFDLLCTEVVFFSVEFFANISELGADTCVANANSTGLPASIRASGSRSVAAERLVVTVADAPPGQFAAMLVGRVAQTSTLPGSAGLLCLGAPFSIYRGAEQIRPIAQDGTFRFPVDLQAIPAGAGFQAVQAGETWLFQGIFRDPSLAGASNLSPAVAVSFVP